VKSILIVCLLLASLTVIAQTSTQADKIVVTGSITDEKGETMVGVNVVVKNTTNGTISDVNGKYLLSVNPNDTLFISFVGYDTKDILVKGRTKIDIKLHENITDLDEVVVIGYGEVKRANLLGSVANISAVELVDYVAPSLTHMIEGRMPGVHVNQRQPSGSPGADTQIQIRTETSFGLSGELLKDFSPLFIVDGFEVSKENYDMLDPSEIESMSVLKDASAAVYGSKGSNGVILVKTNRGKEGKLKVSYSGSVGVSDATTMVEMMSAYDHARTINARYIDEPDKLISAEELEAMKDLDYNWVDDAWQKSIVTKHALTFSGGTSRVKYFVGGNYMYTNANFPEMGYGKYSLRLGLDAEIAKGLYASATVSFDDKDWQRPDGASFGSLLNSPKWKPAFIDGLPVGNGTNAPLYLYEIESYRRDVNKGNTLNLRLTYDFEKIKGLRASASYSRRETHGYIKNYTIPYTVYEFGHPEDFIYILNNEIISPKTVTNDDRIFERYTHGSSYQLNLSLNYNKTIGQHNFASFFTYEQYEGEGFDFQGVSEFIQTYGLELQQAFLTPYTSGGMSESGDLGAVLRLNYGFADKYLLESTLRFETTTKFAPGEREAWFPSVSVGWVASKESFIQEYLSFMDFMKIRFSMGLTGLASVAPYEYMRKYSVTGQTYLFGSDVPASGLGVGGKTDVISTGVSWEKSLMHNLGLDLKFLDNKLDFSMDAFYTYQYDILDKRTVEFPLTAGMGQMPGENIGRLEAWGFDGKISYRGTIGSNAFWKISGNFDYATNRIIEMPTEYPENDFRYPIGRSTYAIDLEQGFINHGIIRTQEQLDAINAEYMEKWGHGYLIDGRPVGLGAFHYEDIGRQGNTSIGEPRTVFEPDGYINEYDKKYLEKINDELTWRNLFPTNLSMSGGWKDVRVNMLWSMAYGFYNRVVDKSARGTATESSNAPSFWADFWTLENPNAKYPSPYYASSNQWVSTFWMKDIYQLRLQNLNVSYVLPREMTKKWGVEQFRIYFSGTNLWTPVSTYKYKDDALNGYSSYPIQRTFNLGINVNI